MVRVKPNIDGIGAVVKPFGRHDPMTALPARVGLYVRDGDVYQVRPAKSDSRRRYALYVGNLYEDDEFDQKEFVKGLVYKLQESERMTPMQAKMYGDKSGRCAWCGHRLTTKRSVMLGIGPVCLKYIGKEHLSERVESDY